MFKNPIDNNSKRFANIQNPTKESALSSTNLKSLNPAYKMSSIYESKNTQRQEHSEHKFKTLYGFNMNGKVINGHNYHYKKNFNKENRSISPNQKLVDNSRAMLAMAAEKESNNALSINKIKIIRITKP
jgi:hypothetical protein